MVLASTEEDEIIKNVAIVNTNTKNFFNIIYYTIIVKVIDITSEIYFFKNWVYDLIGS
jgi:hypothetical protein